jgi:hypothetical protein
MESSLPPPTSPGRFKEEVDGGNTVATTATATDDGSSMDSNSGTSLSSWTVKLADRDESFPSLPLELQHVISIERWNDFCHAAKAAFKDRYRPDLENRWSTRFLVCNILFFLSILLMPVLGLTAALVFAALFVPVPLAWMVFFYWYHHQSIKHTRSCLVECCQEQEASFFKDHGLSLQFVPPVYDTIDSRFAWVIIKYRDSASSLENAEAVC